MARWRLAAPHYLRVPGSEWEYKEVDRATGKQKKVNFPVPQLLDPDQPADWNHVYGKDQGEIIVCHKGKGEPRDIEFVNKDGGPGDPTPDMVPLDDEAKAISASYEKKWRHPIETLSGTYADAILDELQADVAELRANAGAAGQVQGMKEMLEMMAAMMKQNQELITKLATQQAPTARRA